MSSTPSVHFEPDVQPAWLWEYLGQPAGTAEFSLNGQQITVVDNIPRAGAVRSADQSQTEETFGFKWQKVDTFDSAASLARVKSWLIEKYGDLSATEWLTGLGENPLVIDAGCGAGVSSAEYFGDELNRIRFLGVDISEAVDVAAKRFSERGYDKAAFMQADISDLPFPERSVDAIFSEGVLHHTDSTRTALLNLAKLLKPGGRFLFYVYRRKGPIREFTDDFIREQLQPMAPQQAWDAMEPLTKLGVALGELDVEIDIPDAIDLLQIPAGKINVQRLFYWHVAKMFYHPELSFDEMNHINYDWYAPRNAARQSIEEVRAWCDEADLAIEREVVEDAGITIVARRRG